MKTNLRDFSTTEQMEQAICDIRRYQAAYMKANNVDSIIMVKWKKGVYGICDKMGVTFYHSPEFHNMTNVLEKRIETHNKATE